MSGPMGASDDGLSTQDLSGRRTEAETESAMPAADENEAPADTENAAKPDPENAIEPDTESAAEPDTESAAEPDTQSEAPADMENTTGTGAESAATEGEDRREDEATEPLLPQEESTGFQERWREIQVRFVDEPRGAVKEADGLVAEVMQRLAATFADERGRLEGEWERGDEVSTEDLRQALRHYRSFFERLLAT